MLGGACSAAGKSDNVAMLVKVEERSRLDDEALCEFGEAHPGWKVERVGGTFVMSPTASNGAGYSSTLSWLLYKWGRGHGYKAFDAQAGFTMPNGDVLSPDCSLIKKSVWKSLDKAVQSSYAKVALDVVVEVIAKTDRVSQVRDKCERYLAYGHKYAVMLDPTRNTAADWGKAPLGFPAPDELLAELIREND